MIKRNDLRDILHKASLGASKPGADGAWDDVLSMLDEQMPVRKKKRRFFLLFFLACGIVACSASLYIYKQVQPEQGQVASAATGKPPMDAALPTNQETHSNIPGTQASGQQTTYPNASADRSAGFSPEGESTGVRTADQAPRFAGQAKTPRPGKSVVQTKGSGKEAFIKPGQPIAAASPVLNTEGAAVPFDLAYSISPIGLHGFQVPGSGIGREPLPAGLASAFKKSSLDSAQKGKDSVKISKDGDKNDDKNIEKHRWSVGSTLGYTFNNFTSRENRSSIPLVNQVYQVGKQLGLHVYCRIPVTRFYQLQPELGIEPYSTNIQINYRTPGESVFTRYNLKRLAYTQIGLSHYFEVRKNLYVSTGLYYAYALPVYGAQRDLVKQESNKMEYILNSSYERTDFSKNVFGLRRNDIGLSGGIEYHVRRISAGVRISRGFMDITPETPSLYHNFNISCRIGYHFEFAKK